jgi:hypothetical protein
MANSFMLLEHFVTRYLLGLQYKVHSQLVRSTIL